MLLLPESAGFRLLPKRPIGLCLSPGPVAAGAVRWVRVLVRMGRLNTHGQDVARVLLAPSDLGDLHCLMLADRWLGAKLIMPTDS